MGKKSQTPLLCENQKFWNSDFFHSVLSIANTNSLVHSPLRKYFQQNVLPYGKKDFSTCQWKPDFSHPRFQQYDEFLFQEIKNSPYPAWFLLHIPFSDADGRLLFPFQQSLNPINEDILHNLLRADGYRCFRFQIGSIHPEQYGFCFFVRL